MSTKGKGFSIQKFVGVTPEQLAKLHKALTTEPIRRTGNISGEGIYHKSFAELKTVSWDTKHESLTIEVIVYDYAIWRRGIGSNRQWETTYDCSSGYTERFVINSILDALDRFKNKQ